MPDEALQFGTVSHTMYVAETAEPVKEEQYNFLEEIMEWSMDSELFLFVKSEKEAEAASMMAISVFPLYYLALVLTMTAATILTIRQLSEKNRYRQQFALLRKLGMERREIVQALKTQFLIYYAMPVVPSALIGVSFILNFGSGAEPGVLVGTSHPLVIAGITLGVFFMVYVVYILLSYGSLKREVMD